MNDYRRASLKAGLRIVREAAGEAGLASPVSPRLTATRQPRARPRRAHPPSPGHPRPLQRRYHPGVSPYPARRFQRALPCRESKAATVMRQDPEGPCQKGQRCATGAACCARPGVGERCQARQETAQVPKVGSKILDGAHDRSCTSYLGHSDRFNLKSILPAGGNARGRFTVHLLCPPTASSLPWPPVRKL
jgi:hypothetical protein